MGQNHASTFNKYQFKYQFRRYIKNKFNLKGHQIKIQTSKLSNDNQLVSWNGNIKIKTLKYSQLTGDDNRDFVFDVDLAIKDLKIFFDDKMRIINCNMLTYETKMTAKIEVSKHSLTELISNHIDTEKQLNSFVFDIKDQQFVLHAKGGNRFGGVRFYVKSQVKVQEKNIKIDIIEQKVSSYGFGRFKQRSLQDLLAKKVNELQFEIPSSKLFDQITFQNFLVTNKGVYLEIKKTSQLQDDLLISKLITAKFNE